MVPLSALQVNRRIVSVKSSQPVSPVLSERRRYEAGLQRLEWMGGGDLPHERRVDGVAQQRLNAR